jgi:uncharacterized protein
MKKITESKVLVRRSKAGLGLYANTTFKRGDCIIEYTGEHISHEESNRRGGKYLFILNKEIVVDGKGRENTARYINHGCKPNAEAETDEYIKPYGCRCDSCTSK